MAFLIIFAFYFIGSVFLQFLSGEKDSRVTIGMFFGSLLIATFVAHYYGQ